MLAAAHRSLASTGKTGVPSYVVVTGMLTLLASGCWQLILMLKGKDFQPDATGKSRRIMKGFQKMPARHCSTVCRGMPWRWRSSSV